MEGSDIDAIRSARSRLEQAASEFGSRLYQNASQQAGPQGAKPEHAETWQEDRSSPGPESSTGEKVYDAEYQVVDDERKAG